MLPIVDIKNNPLRKGKFSASRISELLAEGKTKGATSKTRLNYIYDIALDKMGCKEDIYTKAMEHGKVNQYDAHNIFKQISGVNTEWFDDFIVINDTLGASPDAKSDSIIAEIKCQYNIINFISQNDVLLKKYYYQVQTQMIANKCNEGYLVNYLTKPELFGMDWVEHPYPVEDRIFWHHIKSDEKIQEEILTAAEKYFPLISVAYDKMHGAITLDEIEFFWSMKAGKIRYIKAKDTNWSEQDKIFYRVNNDFYVLL